MAGKEQIPLSGEITEVIPGQGFRVRLPNGHELFGFLSRKDREHFDRLTVGDRVTLVATHYDLSKGIVQIDDSSN